MVKSQVILIHRNQSFAAKAAAIFSKKAISCSYFHDSQPLKEIWRNGGRPPAIVIEADPLILRSLVAGNGSCPQSPLYMSNLFLVAIERSAALPEYLRNHPRVKYYFSNVDIAVLVNDIGERIRQQAPAPLPDNFLRISSGELQRHILTDIFDFAGQVRFSGQLNVVSGQQRGHAHFSAGKIERIEAPGMDFQAGLKWLLGLESGSYYLDQKVFTLADFPAVQGIAELNSDAGSRAVLADIFTQLYRHLSLQTSREKLHLKITGLLDKQSTLVFENIYLHYDDTAPEKLRIFGNPDRKQVSLILDIFEDIYRSVLPARTSGDFNDFLRSIEALENYIAILNSARFLPASKIFPPRNGHTHENFALDAKTT